MGSAAAFEQLFPMAFRLRDYKAPAFCSGLYVQMPTAFNHEGHEGSRRSYFLQIPWSAVVLVVLWCVSWFDFLD
jgi:hypothetical protein